MTEFYRPISAYSLRGQVLKQQAETIMRDKGLGWPTIKRITIRPTFCASSLIWAILFKV